MSAPDSPDFPEIPLGGFVGEGLPEDPANTTGRKPIGNPAEVPELAEVDCPPELQKEIETAMARYPEKSSASIPALWAVQRLYGWCSPEGVRQAAAVMGVTPAHLESVASFYDLFFLEPTGRHRVRVCTNISCWMRGGDRLLGAFAEATGCDPGKASHGGTVSDDGEFFVTGSECLGACDLAPMASIDERYYGPLTEDDAAVIVREIRNGSEPEPELALASRGLAGGADPTDDPRADSLKGPNR